jgi:hypothetical protein
MYGVTHKRMMQAYDYIIWFYLFFFFGVIFPGIMKKVFRFANKRYQRLNFAVNCMVYNMNI